MGEGAFVEIRALSSLIIKFTYICFVIGVDSRINSLLLIEIRFPLRVLGIWELIYLILGTYLIKLRFILGRLVLECDLGLLLVA